MPLAMMVFVFVVLLVSVLAVSLVSSFASSGVFSSLVLPLRFTF